MPKITRAALHFWEEPIISGERGSGTVFFSGCSLGCVYCQNKAISRASVGRPVTDSELSDISLHLILPCRDQDSRWSARDRERYQRMLDLADSHVYLYEGYANGVMAARNRALVNAADLCIAYMASEGSGTGLTVSMARRRGIPVRNLAEE